MKTFQSVVIFFPTILLHILLYAWFAKIWIKNW